MKNVLLVDDDDDLREALSDVLAFGGYEVTAVRGGPEALEWLEDHRPDVILLDLMMPGMSGAEVVGRMERERRGIPVLVLSGDTRLPEQAAALGAAGWISKPATMETLLEAVAQVA